MILYMMQKPDRLYTWSLKSVLYSAKLSFTLLLTLSCSDTLNIDIPVHESQVVVEGWIESGDMPRILLTRSAPYFSAIDSHNIRDYVVSTATVTITTDSIVDFCIFKPGSRYFPPYYYLGNQTTGLVNKSYFLEIFADGKRITATTTIPEPVGLDSVWFELNDDSDSLGLIWIRFRDPAGEDNYYRTLTQRKGIDADYVPTLTTAFRDDYYEGKEMTLALRKGKGVLDPSNEQYFRLGDTIDLKFCTMDKQSYDFWNTYQVEIINSANPFATSNAKIKSNIVGGYGIWGGYGLTKYRIIATKNPGY